MLHFHAPLCWFGSFTWQIKDLNRNFGEYMMSCYRLNYNYKNYNYYFLIRVLKLAVCKIVCWFVCPHLLKCWSSGRMTFHILKVAFVPRRIRAMKRMNSCKRTHFCCMFRWIDPCGSPASRTTSFSRNCSALAWPNCISVKELSWTHRTIITLSRGTHLHY